MLTSLLSMFGLKEIILILIAAWLIFAVVKRLAKIAVLAVILFALVYFLYPMLAPVFNSR